MAILRFTDRPFNPWAEFERIRQGLDQLSRTYFEEAGARSFVYPPLNIFEDAENIVIKAEVPGIGIEDLDIQIEGDTLTIKGSRKAGEAKEGVSYHRREIQSGTFSRAITLPTQIDADGVQARLTDGILTITLPRAAEVKPRRIAVTAD